MAERTRPQLQMLLDGDLDGIVVPDLIPPLLEGHPNLRRLLFLESTLAT